MTKILVVEDTLNKLQVIRNILDRYELKYDVAETGKDALMLEKEHHYDIVILDIELPWNEGDEIIGYPGIEIMRKFDEKESKIKAIVFSTIRVEEIWKQNGEEPPKCFLTQAVFSIHLDWIIKRYV